VFATAWADFVIELFTNHLFHAALGEGQDFVDFVLHFRFPFSFLTSYIDILQTRLEVVNKKKKIFLRFFWHTVCSCKYHAKTLVQFLLAYPPCEGPGGAAPSEEGFPHSGEGVVYRCSLLGGKPSLSQLGCTFSDNAPQ
jgi:hypothetical protein